MFIQLLAFLFPIVSFGQDGYGRIQNAESRMRQDSGYTWVKEFPRIEIVKENDGTPNPQLVEIIPDSYIRNQINERKFTSLQVRDLGLMIANTQRETNLIVIPFGVSVKHTQQGINRGTIEVYGRMVIVLDRGVLNVEVIGFDDSKEEERLGRRMGTNSNIDLRFAKNIVKGQLEGYFNSDPTRIASLVKMIPEKNMGLR